MFYYENSKQRRTSSFNDLSDIGFQDFVNMYKRCTAKPYSFLVIDATLASDNPLRFRKNPLERIWKLMKTITDDKIRDEKLQCNINREKEKYQHYHPEKLINMNILPVKK